MKWGSFGTTDGQFQRVLDLALDAQGDIYVVDDHRDDIQKFDPKVKFIIKFGEEGRGDGELNNTGGITIGPDETCMLPTTVITGSKFSVRNGKYLRQWPTRLRRLSYCH